MVAHGETRARVVATARRLLSSQGYDGTGINQVLAEAEAPRGSLYFHFPGGKQQLAVEAMNLAAEDTEALLNAAIEHAPDPPAAIRVIADLMASRLVDSDFRNGCPLATVALDVGADNSPVREACGAGYGRWLDSIAGHLTRVGVRHDVADDLAAFALSSLEGALLLARSRRDASLVHAVGNRVAAAIAEEIGNT